MVKYIQIERRSNDGLSRKVWDFRFDGAMLRLVSHGVEHRAKPRGRFKAAKAADRWQYMDERAFSSGLPRPQSIPADVIRDAIRDITIAVHIGWTNAESCIDEIRLADMIAPTNQPNGETG
ncbi:MAG: hypothetical protein VX529_10390 [Pseudomonadota bacterium]|nr:hypothetical protein [Pseudomonadota bacterium]